MVSVDWQVPFAAVWLSLTAWSVFVRATSERARAAATNAEFGCMIAFLLGSLIVILLAVDHVSISFH